MEIIKILIPPLFTFLAGLFGVFFGVRQAVFQKKIDFYEKQINELYSPLLGLRKDIQAKSELRLKISKAADISWKEICEKHSKPFFDHEEYFEPFDKIINYDNKQLTDDLLPQYREMQKIIKEKMGLALSETRNWYIELTNFIELWNRWEQKSIPVEVIKKLDHGEHVLNEFYEHIESVINDYQLFLKDLNKMKWKNGKNKHF